MFKKVNSRQNFPEMEKDVLKFWQESKIFEKSVERKSDEKTYSFFDGPPFATGMPHYGHMVASLIKDVVPRYWTMRGYKVERRWGWDCHGLPIENLIEKEHNIKNKQDIEKWGVDKFNDACHASVLRYADEWKKFIPRMGRWVDMENDYRTMDWKYTESIWWVFSELYKKGLVYEGYKAMHICPRCETTLSNFEVTQGYKEITDLSATVKFKLKYPAGNTGRGVGALVYNEKNEVLLLRRNENGRRKTWAMPGGKTDGGETFREALEREVGEELGVKIESAEPFVAKPDIFEGRLFETVCFKVKIKGEPNIMEKNKIDKLEWFSLDNLPEVDYPPSRDALEVYKQNKELFYFDIDMSKPLSSVYILAWTTTPWTLPGNVALAIGKDIEYVMVKMENDFYVLAKDRIEDIFKDKQYEVLNKFKGKELVGMEYEPLFGYYSKKEDLENKENAMPNGRRGWKIYAGDFVATEEGAGIVHIAPAFGDDDMNLGKKYNLPFVQHVKMNGRFAEEVADFRDKDGQGKEVKPKRNPRETDEKIVEFLEKNNKLFTKENYKHSYPHCWRCDTPLLNYATSSWFVSVTAIKDKMIKNNQQMNWMPEYIKDGRFGKWLEDARDWAVSRSRFWGAPLPVWRCGECKNIEVADSIDNLREKANQKITKIIFVRHGESESNPEEIRAGQLDGYPLTEKGRKQSEDIAEILKKEKIDVFISSPVLRAKQTAEIISEKLGIKYIEDARVKEYNYGLWDGYNSKNLLHKEDKIYKEYKKLNYCDEEKYDFKFGGNGESRKDVESRVRNFIEEICEKYIGKTLLIVSHGGINAMLYRVIDNISIQDFYKYEFRLGNAEKNVFYVDENAKEFNLHKPNIDKIKITCSKCGGEASIVGDVFDCWFESGSMPYAQWHYPFENRDKFEKGFPAEFIAEGLDQTRGWFYTLIVLSSALFDKPAAKNVIVNGIVLAENGQKMSKRLKNYPEPEIIINKYGADSLRYYFLTSPVMKAENLRFSEKGVEEVLKRFVLTLWNGYSFFVMNTYPSADFDKQQIAMPILSGDEIKSNNLLDKWITSELNILIAEVNKQMENYDLVRATRPLREFIDKLSNWYIRRSRKRFALENMDDRNYASMTLYYILTEYAKLLAPFMPFLAEEIYRNITGRESVHLEDYPAANKNLIDEKVSNEMNFVRDVVALGLAIRAKNSIKVRQPLRKLEIKKLEIGNWKLEIEDELMSLIKDELNIKEVEFVEDLQIGSTALRDNGASDDDWIYEDDGKIKIGLNIKITDELRTEGSAREIVRHIQAMRKEAKYNRNDLISVKYNFSEGGEEIKKIFEVWGSYIKKECLAKEIVFSEGLDKNDFDLIEELKVGDGEIRVGIKKLGL